MKAHAWKQLMMIVLSVLSVLATAVVSHAADTTRPKVTAFAIPAASATLTVAINTLTATDNVAVTGYLVKESSTTPSATAAGWSALAPTSYTFSTVGAKRLYAWAKDAAGNVSGSRNDSVTIDMAPPTVTAFTVPATARSLTVTISGFTATDNVRVAGYVVNESATAPLATASGWSVTAPTSYTFSTPGSKVLYAWAKDAAGNVSASRNGPVIVDMTVPTVTVFTVPAAATALTVAITGFTATDNIGVTGYLVNESATAPLTTASGWSASAPASYTFATAGTKTLYAWAKDAAGNVSVARQATVTVTLPDTMPPIVSTFTIPATSTMMVVPITSFTATDNVGVTGYLVNESATAPLSTAPGWSASAPASYTFATAGSKTLYAWAKDAAGNVSASKNASITIVVSSGGPTPILIISSTENPFSGYYAEILRNEGLNSFAINDISAVTATMLASHDVVILGEMTLTASQVTMLSNWVSAGGKLIAMRPDSKLAGLMGLSGPSSTLPTGICW